MIEQFSLEKWLENPSRKVVTRDGRPVRILCTDAKAKDGCCIIAAIETDGEEEGYQFFKNGKAYSSKSSIEDCADLFFADNELTEFEKELEKFRTHILTTSGEKYDKNGECVIKKVSRNLLDLARKEIEKEFKDEEYFRLITEHYKQGKKEALKDLPKWKKATEKKDLEKYIAILEENKVLLSNYIEEGDYYIDLEDLKALPKEE